MTVRNIHQRIHAVMQSVDYIQKQKKQGMQYTFASHDAVTAKVRPVLVEHGVIYYPVAMARIQDGNRTEIDVTIRFTNIDDPTDFIDVASCGYGVDAQDKGPGKAISYAVKYALLKALGLETGDDPEQDSIDHQPQPPRQAAADAAPKVSPAEAEWTAWATERAAEYRGVPTLDDLEFAIGLNVVDMGKCQTQAPRVAKKLLATIAQMRAQLGQAPGQAA